MPDASVCVCVSMREHRCVCLCVSVYSFSLETSFVYMQKVVFIFRHIISFVVSSQP